MLYVLREALSQPGAVLRWVDGSRNIADILTKLGVDKTYLFKVMRKAMWTLVQDADAAAVKERKRAQRTARKVKDKEDKPEPEAAKRLVKEAQRLRR